MIQTLSMVSSSFHRLLWITCNWKDAWDCRASRSEATNSYPDHPIENACFFCSCFVCWFALFVDLHLTFLKPLWEIIDCYMDFDHLHRFGKQGDGQHLWLANKLGVYRISGGLQGGSLQPLPCPALSGVGLWSKTQTLVSSTGSIWASNDRQDVYMNFIAFT